ncbi:phage tail protein [Pseudomonas chlororaphis]|uniref:phage tail protein n=1 Tax=Pseudomonas chlororaphis TaxID=587753 RepID=UPI0015DFB5C0|nr:phage tail protein [Pseudomonas chlororaphis subsp. aurantiaca]
MAWLRAGTVAVTNGSTTVTGTGTGFAANTRVGDAFIGPDGRQYELANVASDTVISITPAYQGATASGASYAIMPVQGYQKGLADQVRDWVNTYGAKMAALGTTGNYDILPLAKGGTGNTTGTATKLAAAAIVGPVSQSGGVPTGAIIESGNGVNGRYTRWADGTQHCWITMNYYTAIDAPQMGVYVSGWITWSFQAPFIARPNVLITARDDTFLFGSSVSGTTAGEVVRFASATPLAAGAKLATLFAVGRWF